VICLKCSIRIKRKVVTIHHEGHEDLEEKDKNDEFNSDGQASCPSCSSW
jgi:hypothetical protein